MRPLSLDALHVQARGFCLARRFKPALLDPLQFMPSLEFQRGIGFISY